MGAGAYLYKKVGDEIGLGEEIGEVHTNDENMGKVVVEDILNAIKLSAEGGEYILKILR
jgi:thymidine phosphorylase